MSLLFDIPSFNSAADWPTSFGKRLWRSVPASEDRSSHRRTIRSNLQKTAQPSPPHRSAWHSLDRYAGAFGIRGARERGTSPTQSGAERLEESLSGACARRPWLDERHDAQRRRSPSPGGRGDAAESFDTRGPALWSPPFLFAMPTPASGANPRPACGRRAQRPSRVKSTLSPGRTVRAEARS